MIKVTLVQSAKPSVDLAWLKQLAAQVLKKEQVKQGELAIVLVEAKQAQELNMQYRGKDYIPGVLAFKANGLAAEQDLGQVVLCLAALRKSAKQQTNALADELALNLIHGVLHLLDYNHDLVTDADVMEAKEERYLRDWLNAAK